MGEWGENWAFLENSRLSVSYENACFTCFVPSAVQTQTTAHKPSNPESWIPDSVA